MSFLSSPSALNAQGPAPGSGAGAVLLLHGLCANPAELQPVTRALTAHGITVETPLVEGCGVDSATVRSGGLQVQRFEAWIEQAVDHLERLKRQHGHVVVGGLCMGAVLSLALAERVETQAQLLISPTLFFDGWNVSPWRRLLPLAYLPGIRSRASFAETAPFGLKNERLRKWVMQSMAKAGVSSVGAARLPANAVYQAQRLIRHVRRSLSAVQSPTRILHAVEDDVASPRTVHYLQRHLGTKPTVRWFHDSYHMLTLDNEREQVVADSLAFVSEHMGRAHRAPLLEKAA